MFKNAIDCQLKKRIHSLVITSVLVSLFVAVVKFFTSCITGSVAVFSDAIESVVHIVTVLFALYSTYLLQKPADKEHSYGHDRIAFFSTSFEGLCVIGAALTIFVSSVQRWASPTALSHVEVGFFLTLSVGAINAVLGFFLCKTGKENHLMALEAHGKHLLTDSLTSAGVGLSLWLTQWTSISLIDPLIALLVAVNIFWMGWKLFWRGIRGLMDHVDPGVREKIKNLLNVATKTYGAKYHALRHRHAGARLLVEVHLLFPSHLTLEKAHELATLIEKNIEANVSHPIELVTHLEPLDGHDEVHEKLLGREG